MKSIKKVYMTLEASILNYRKKNKIKVKTVAERIMILNKCSYMTARAMVWRVESGIACLYTINLVLKALNCEIKIINK